MPGTKNIRLEHPEIAERFMVGVMTEYYSVLDQAAESALKSICDRSIKKDDLIQEIFIYMLKYNLPKVEQLSTEEKLWMPYVKQAAANCITNLIKKYSAQKRFNISVSFDDIVNTDSESNLSYFPTSSTNCPDRLVELKHKFIAAIRILTGLERKVLGILMRSRNVEVCKKVTYKEIAEYLKLPYDDIRKAAHNAEIKLRGQLLSNT